MHQMKRVPRQMGARTRQIMRALQAAAQAFTVLQALSACADRTTGMPPERTQAPGTVEWNQASPNDAPDGGGGSGTVFFDGQLYHFSIGGLGVEGSAVAIIQTAGRVYRLDSMARFPGTYRQAGPDASLPISDPSGLWLRNQQGVVIHLQVPPQGRMPALGADAVRIVLDQ